MAAMQTISNIGGFLADRVGIGGTAKDILKDPLRLGAAALTGGASELAKAADDKLFNDPRNKAEDLATKNAARANALVDEQQAQLDQQDAVKQRDLQRARMRAIGANAGGRSTTILTGPLGGATSSSSSGAKTLLGE